MRRWPLLALLPAWLLGCGLSGVIRGHHRYPCAEARGSRCDLARIGADASQRRGKFAGKEKNIHTPRLQYVDEVTAMPRASCIS